MSIETILQQLNEYHPDELFYKDYYFANKNHLDIQQFLNNYSKEDLIQRKLIVTELKDGWLPNNMNDHMFFDTHDIHDICLSKHYRYTPTFNHKHTFFEFVYVVSGTCHQTINGNELELTQGQFCIVAPLTTHSISVFDDSIVINIILRRKTFEDIFYNLFRHSNKITDFVNQSLYLYQQSNYMTIDTNKDILIRNMVLDMYTQYITQDKFNELVLNTELMYMISIILQRHEEGIHVPLTPYSGDKNILKIISYIEKNYKTVTLSDTAEAFNFSTSYFSRLIKKHTDKSFTYIVLGIKFDKVTSMLETTDININEIAYLVGFESNEHFYRLFKKRFDMTPGEYRLCTKK